MRVDDVVQCACCEVNLGGVAQFFVARIHPLYQVAENEACPQRDILTHGERDAGRSRVLHRACPAGPPGLGEYCRQSPYESDVMCFCFLD